MTFPVRPNNRPALDRIRYRIGTYAEFREAMLRQLDQSTVLSSWTHRAPDDPGIALIEGAAVVADILTFYQEHYANEAFLRTARWRESIAELVRLLGYRLSPGVGGQATFALEVKGTTPVTIPASFPVKAELATSKSPVDFQTTAELVAYPHLGKFRLYRPRAYATALPAGTTRFELASVAGQSDASTLATAALKVGDRLCLVPNEAMWTTNGTAYSSQPKAQILKITKVTPLLDRTVLEVEGGLVRAWTAPIIAYRVNRSFRHFGHNAPINTVTPTPSSGPVTGATQAATRFTRDLQWDCGCTSSSDTLLARVLPLDQPVNDLAAGGKIILQAWVNPKTTGHNTAEPYTTVRTMDELTAASLTFGNLSGPSTLLTLKEGFISNTSRITSAQADIRTFQVHEVTSARLTLRAASNPGSDAATPTTLGFYGTLDQAKTLLDRRLLLQGADGTRLEVRCTQSLAGLTAQNAGDPLDPHVWQLTFNLPLTPFLSGQFSEDHPAITVYGNLVDATQGKAEKETVLGNGDNRQAFQTFKLPKAPLTFLLAATATPPEVPELEIHVNRRLWTRVDALFGHGPLEEIYTVRLDNHGDAYVQFGDGVTGARLPTGLKNVVALYRTGAGANGALKPNTQPSPGQPLTGLDKIHLPGEVTGGADPESGDKARLAAPGEVQSLNRLVSLRDYETETLGIPGVVTATAAWGLADNIPAVLLRVLLEEGRDSPDAFATVRDTIAGYQRSRGPNRFAVHVQPARLRYVHLDLEYAFDPRLIRDDVEAAIRSALGLAGDEANERAGLFGLRHRRLGESEYATRIEATTQNLAGIHWCRVTALGLFPFAEDPTALALPASPRARTEQIAIEEHELLQLLAAHLTLTAVNPVTA